MMMKGGGFCGKVVKTIEKHGIETLAEQGKNCAAGCGEMWMVSRNGKTRRLIHNLSSACSWICSYGACLALDGLGKDEQVVV
jgi:hypothetical protein